ncbi:hypothetical protein SAMD00019534_060180 [Acytostelium subglobosum LB1]|uniref:hypothetical protein n=1 Tax=Acytostelium subglobosum LB1 TaxID=1410327 RepID=UPI0006449183|nr:hypothetical protein SAMD00019534_060180 [Acytostelium subglobosum LB1]GAM22843.1 hypothetical protein SAMD00019534_060180 [Acytostelium subglobosum LB1]|eukprot:XP_012754070.1 hypothetical protein SAMD00019534_060180 [Acytostelium subglobosum LB1]
MKASPDSLIIKDILEAILGWIAWLLNILFPPRLVVDNVKLEVLHLDKPVRIVQISDIHYDHTPIRIDDELMEQVVQRVNEQSADLVVITGDLVQYQPEPVTVLVERHLSKLRANVGVYSIYGNHDYKTAHGPEMIANALKTANITMLHNETTYPMGRGKGKLQLVGLGDYGRKRVHFKLDKVKGDIVEAERPRVVLSHNPDSAFDLEPYDIDLVLSGHTHGGQICFPNGTPMMPLLDKLLLSLPKMFLLSISYPSKVLKSWTWSRGHHVLRGVQLDKPKAQDRPMNLYINRGLATHPPLRLFCHPEITVIDLIPKV